MSRCECLLVECSTWCFDVDLHPRPVGLFDVLTGKQLGGEVIDRVLAGGELSPHIDEVVVQRDVVG